MRISFQSSDIKNSPAKVVPDNIEGQVRQVMRENYAPMEAVIVDNCAKRIESEFAPQFRREVIKAKKEIGKQDLANILTSLQSAYQQAGLKKDADVLGVQLQRIELQG